ncbi:MAG: HAMP domain-containing protein [Synergistaceae bacterium]|nr:HAMP domain-containing protein [Synergistaceae bacterium]
MKKHKTKRSLKAQLSLNIALVALLTVALISVLSNIFIKRRFEDYILEQQRQRTEEILSSLSQQYDENTQSWNLSFVHAIGMHALYDGYIVEVDDASGGMLWDAETCDMSACARVIEDISQKMRTSSPGLDGKFTETSFALTRNGQKIGAVRVNYFAPYFFDENDVLFLEALNTVLVGSGVFSLLLAIIVGWLLARRMSNPIRRTAEVAKQMSGGDYAARIEEKTSVLELDELVLSVNRLARSLSEQENLRKQLTADVAHELRTPLTTIGTHIEAMIEGVWQPTKERLSSCHEEIQRISKLVRDIESLARVESDNLKLDKAPVNLRELAEKTLRSFETEIADKKLRLSVEGSSPEIWADRDRIRQVLVNLLSNAVKYTPPNGNIRVILSEMDAAALLVVEDDGTGIPEEELPMIFERFYRADKSRNRMSGGSGIGLAIVRSIVTAHGGKVEAGNRFEGGSRFQVRLPVKAAGKI